jgi:hypothetical protein
MTTSKICGIEIKNLHRIIFAVFFCG